LADLGKGQRPVIMPKYPHMMAEDTLVWTRFLQTESHRLKEVWYDVHVGQSVIFDMGLSDLEQRIADGVTRKRIDVVASVGGGFWIIEVKPHASMYAVGQVLTYRRLFVKEYRPKGIASAVIVADSYDPDLLGQFDEMGVLVFVNE
jgi:hypothetical protein